MRELPTDGIPVTVTCRVLTLARQPYYRRLDTPITSAELDQAYRANALFNAHRDDPELRYRYLLEEAADAGQPMAARTAWKRDPARPQRPAQHSTTLSSNCGR